MQLNKMCMCYIAGNGLKVLRLFGYAANKINSLVQLNQKYISISGDYYLAKEKEFTWSEFNQDLFSYMYIS